MGCLKFELDKGRLIFLIAIIHLKVSVGTGEKKKIPQLEFEIYFMHVGVG